MKNIFIVGVPRTGKSTLSKMIKEKYPIYNQFSFEAIRNGFIETQPQLKMDYRNSDARKNILPKHIVLFAHWNEKLLSNPSLIEGDFCSIEQLKNYTDCNDIIICLGHGCRTLDEIVASIRINDTEDDYTKEWTEEKLNNHFKDIVEKDKKYYDFCTKNCIKYYDTFDNRKVVFEQIIQKILEE